MAQAKRRKSKLDPYLDHIGVLPDREVAEMAGVTPENVRAFRARRNIPAGWRGEGRSYHGDMIGEFTGAAGGPQGFAVNVITSEGPVDFVVLAEDIAQAAALAMRRLGARGVEGRIQDIRYLAEALTG
ncbi:MAG: hypothetical protein ABIO70_07190 [Pseudomonadota bacterium]